MPPSTTVAAFPKPTPAPPPPPRPIRWRLDFGVNVGSTVVGDPGLRAFAERRNLLETGVSTLFDFRLAEGRFFVGGGVAYQHVGRDGEAHGQVDTNLQLHEPQVLGRASFMVVEGVDAFARAAVGPSFVRASYDSNSFESTRQRDVLPRVDGRAGLLLYLPKAWLPRKQASATHGAASSRPDRCCSRIPTPCGPPPRAGASSRSTGSAGAWEHSCA
jgi:hypothetical protein